MDATHNKAVKRTPFASLRFAVALGNFTAKLHYTKASVYSRRYVKPSMKIFLFIFSLFVSSMVCAKTPWEIYLDLPNQANAKNVVSIEYSEAVLPNGNRYWAPDLEILKLQVLAGDKEAFLLTYRLMTSSGGGLLEELMAILASSIRPQTEIFLKEISILNTSERTLSGILECLVWSMLIVVWLKNTK